MQKLKFLLLLLLIFPAISFSQSVNLSQGLISYYPFNHQGNPYADSSGFGRDLTRSGTMAPTADRHGNTQLALQITEGILQDYMLQPLPTGNQPRSFSVWFNKSFPTQLEPNIQFLCFYGSIGQDAGCGLALDYMGDLYFAGYQNDVIQSFSLNFNQWYHIAAVYDGTTASLYLDGNLIGQAPKTWATQAGGLRLGAMLVGIAGGGGGGGSQIQYTNAFTGSMDEFRLYNRVLNYKEIQVLAGKTIAGTQDDLIAKEAITLQPNPASDQISFNITPAELAKIEGARILDVTGRTVKNLSPKELLSPVSVQTFLPGIYTVQVTGKQNVITRKFIKQ